MGYLNKSTVTVDAILTKKGRELLARGRSAFVISQFAVADDEVDYGLYNPAHPLGSEYYGSAIENMPIVEAVPDETQNLRYKLVTLRQGTNVIPRINVGLTSISLIYSSNPVSQPINPKTDPLSDLLPFGYTAILYDGGAATLTSDGLPGTATAPALTANTFSENAVVLRGTSFSLTPKQVSTVTQTQLTIVGNETGASITIPVTINPATVI